LASAARGALRKFTFDLDPRGALDGTASLDPSAKHVYFAVPPETAGTEDQLDTLSDALLRRKKVAFTYHGIQRNQATEREVRPYGLLFKHSHWYLVGWDETRDAQRIFRVDRMEKVQANSAAPATPDYAMPPEPVLEAYRNQEAWELGEGDDTTQALVRFRFPASLWAERNGYGEAVGEGDDGSALRRFEVRQPDPFLRWILSQEGEASIESPPALQEALRTLAKQVAALYQEDANA
jgi:predicted DNA-binding transcriptional regulator YafY